MKYITTICLWLAITIAAHSQKKIFIRVFDQSGNKIEKGFLTSVSDSSLTIQRGKEMIEVPVPKISAIKIKRSFGNTVAISSAIGAGSFSLLGAASATTDPEVWINYSAGEGAATGFIFGAVAGATVGSIIAATKKRPVLQINGDKKEWMKAKSALSYYLEK